MEGQTVLAKMSGRWQALSITHKVSLVMLVIGLLLAFYYLSQFARQMNYTTLFAQLDPREAGAIVEQLDGMGIPHMLSEGGTTIQVPRNRVDEARIHLATAGALGIDGAGWELFDRTKLGITEFEQQINYQRALQEELRRTIVRLNEVEAARVHLVMPERSVFVDEQVHPSASIALKLRPASGLDSSQVRGIVALVVGSVEGLESKNVQVIDMRGRLLNEDGHQDPVTGVALTHQEIKRGYERELEQRVQNMLQRVVGPERVVAMVTADLDFSRQESVSTTPHGEPQIVSEQTIREEREGTAPGGVPGVDANIEGPATYPLAGMTQSETYFREERITNYQVGTLQQTLVQPPGELRRLSASVVVDGDVTPGQAEQIQNLVTTALGLDPDRGDQILVVPMAFDTTYQEQLEAELARTEAAAVEKERQQLILYAAAAGALLLLLLTVAVIGLIVARRRRAEPVLESAVVGVAPQPAPPVVPDIVQMSDKQQIARELARQKPDEVAQIVKVWLAEK